MTRRRSSKLPARWYRTCDGGRQRLDPPRLDRQVAAGVLGRGTSTAGDLEPDDERRRGGRSPARRSRRSGRRPRSEVEALHRCEPPYDPRLSAGRTWPELIRQRGSRASSSPAPGRHRPRAASPTSGPPEGHLGAATTRLEVREHRRLPARSRPRVGVLRRAGSPCSQEAEPNDAHHALAPPRATGARGGDRDAERRRASTSVPAPATCVEVHGSIHAAICLGSAARPRPRACRAAAAAPALCECGRGRSSPAWSCSASCCPRVRDRARDRSSHRLARLLARRRLVARGVTRRASAARDARSAGGSFAIVNRAPTRSRRPRRACGWTAARRARCCATPVSRAGLTVNSAAPLPGEETTPRATRPRGARCARRGTLDGQSAAHVLLDLVTGIPARAGAARKCDHGLVLVGLACAVCRCALGHLVPHE